MRGFNRLIWKFAIGIFLLAMIFILSSCNCFGDAEDEDDTNDDVDDDTDDDTSDDDGSDDDAEGWSIYTIDSDRGVGEFSSIAADSSDKIHISYYDNGSYPSFRHDLRYATNKSGSWQTFTIDSEGWTGWYTSIALDSNDKVHISYAGNKKVKYATNKSKSWQILILGDVSYNPYSSIALDSNDKVHIAYHYCGDYDDENDACTVGDLLYVTNASGTWQTHTIDSWEWTGDIPSIATHPTSKVYICYLNHHLGLRYATNSAGWKKEVVAGGLSEYCDIAIDSNNKAHISSAGVTLLNYSTNASGSWEFFNIAPDIRGCITTSIALDSNDKVHISFDERAGLKYATNKSGTWEILTIDSGDVGGFNSIAVDPNDYVHISYYDSTNSSLKYATNRPPE